MWLVTVWLNGVDSEQFCRCSIRYYALCACPVRKRQLPCCGNAEDFHLSLEFHCSIWRRVLGCMKVLWSLRGLEGWVQKIKKEDTGHSDFKISSRNFCKPLWLSFENVSTIWITECDSMTQVNFQNRKCLAIKCQQKLIWPSKDVEKNVVPLKYFTWCIFISISFGLEIFASLKHLKVDCQAHAL